MQSKAKPRGAAVAKRGGPIGLEVYVHGALCYKCTPEIFKARSQGCPEIQLLEVLKAIYCFKRSFDSVDVVVWKSGIEYSNYIFNRILTRAAFNTFLKMLLSQALEKR
jgi:hypothetical protein